MTYAAIQSLIYDLTKTDSSSFPVATLNLYTQPAEDRITTIILKNDSKWQFDDLNRTATFPIDTQNLVSGQQDYALGTSYLSLDRVELLPNGASTTTGWTPLTQLDQQDLKRGNLQSLTSYRAVAGTPIEYDIVGNSVFLYPAPNYAQANSLKFYYTRGPLHFDYTLGSGGTFTDATGSSTSTPGFASLFHPLLAYEAAFDYATVNGLANIPYISQKVLSYTADLIEYYGERDRDLRGRFTMSTNRTVGSISGVVGNRGGDSNK